MKKIIYESKIKNYNVNHYGCDLKTPDGKEIRFSENINCDPIIINKYEYMWKKLKKSLEEMIDSEYAENKEIFEIMLGFMKAEEQEIGENNGSN